MATRPSFVASSLATPAPCELILMAKPPAPALEVMRRLPALACAVDKLHMTILPLGDIRCWQTDEFAGLEAELGAVREGAFPVLFNRIRANRRHAQLVGTAMREARAFRRHLLGRLHAPVTRVLERQSRTLPDNAPRPHITLDYHSELACNEPIAPIDWMVEEFLLIESVHGAGHVERGRWPLVRTLL